MTEPETAAPLQVEALSPDAVAAALPALAAMMQACVLGGASIGFVLPFAIDESEAFWNGLLPDFRSGARRLIVARWQGEIAGTAQLVLAAQPNGRHRAEVAKVMVHPDRRRLGIARALMQEIEAEARRCRRTLLLLDTVAEGPAEWLYRSVGFESAGLIPNYALSTTGALETTHFFYKILVSS
jgi:GNAT superfamily N-acetyltransferase